MVSVRKLIYFVILLILVFQSTGNAAKNSGDPVTGTSGQGVYSLKVDVDAPPSFLYPYLIREELISKWNQDKSVRVSFPKGIEPCIGKQIRVSLKYVPTSPWMLMEIVELTEPERVTTRFIDGVLTGEFSYILSPTETGGTHLVQELRIKPVGALTTMVWEIHGKRVYRNKMGNFLAQIKKVVEHDFAKSQSEHNISHETAVGAP